MVRGTFVSLSLAIGIAACSFFGPSGAAPVSASFKPTRCFSAPGLVEGSTIRCGTVQVPMVSGGKGVVTLFVTIVGSNSKGAKQAVFHLPGGPGASAESYAPILASTYLPLSEAVGKPIIFVDQRGTGRSKPFLECSDIAVPAKCSAAWAAAKIDPLAFTTPNAADDLAAVAGALGLSSIDVWGASYGSRLALETVRRHANLVRSLVIESVDTSDSQLDDAQDILAALTRVGSECASNAACNGVIPDLVATTEATAKTLATAPLVTQLGIIDTNMFLSDVSSLMEWSRGISFVPAYIASVRDRDAAAAEAFRGVILSLPFPGGQFSEAMNRLVNCTDIAPFNAAAAMGRNAASTENLLSQARRAQTIEQYVKPCAGWPVDPTMTNQPVLSDVPTLVLTGAIDSNTPLENAQFAASHLTNSTIVTFPSTGHFAVHQGGNPCGESILAAFFLEPAASVKTKCVGKAKPIEKLPLPLDANFQSAFITSLGFSADVPEGWITLDHATWRTAGGVVVFARAPGRIKDAIAAVASQVGLETVAPKQEMIGNLTWTQVSGPDTNLLFYQAKNSVVVLVVGLSNGGDVSTFAKRIARSITSP